MTDQDQIPTQLVRELPNKRRLEDRITSNTLIVFIALDVVLRIIEIVMGH